MSSTIERSEWVHARTNNRHVSLWNTAGTRRGSWVLTCNRHHETLPDTNRKRLETWMRYPQRWCTACHDEHWNIWP